MNQTTEIFNTTFILLHFDHSYSTKDKENRSSACYINVVPDRITYTGDNRIIQLLLVVVVVQDILWTRLHKIQHKYHDDLIPLLAS